MARRAPLTKANPSQPCFLNCFIAVNPTFLLQGTGLWPSLSQAKKNPSRSLDGFFRVKCLAIPYFRMETFHTIIGAKRFHFRVRDGIGWFTLAMVTKQTGVVDSFNASTAPAVPLSMDCLRKSVHTSQNSLKPGYHSCTQTAWVLYGQASRAISTG